jgi:hypothetical protein
MGSYDGRMEPGSESPAVASLVVFGRRFAPVARAAIVLDLAARGAVDLVREPGGPVLCEEVRTPWDEPLLPFDQAVLDCLAERLEVGGAPVATLLPDPRDDAGRSWTNDLGRRVFAEARRLGLVVPGVMLGFRRTAAGQTVAARWAAFGETLRASSPAVLTASWAPLRDPLAARAVAAGAAPELVADLTPADARHVWSEFGGRWRLLSMGRPVNRAPRGTAAADSFDAQVVRRWKTGFDDGATWYLAVDDGATAEARAWSVLPDLHARFPAGSRVRVAVDARGRLVDVTPA